MSVYNTRRGRGNPKDVEESSENVGCSKIQPMKQELLVWKNKAELLESKVKELETHNDELRQQLEHLSAQGDSQCEREGLEDSSESLEDSSDDSSSSDEDSSSSEEESHKKKNRNKMKKTKGGKKKKNKHQRKEKDRKKRANTIDDVVKRYQRLLKHTKKGLTMTRAFQKENVSRNAVAQLAPIAELYIADQYQFQSVPFKPGKLAEFATKCQEKIRGELKENIDNMKKKGLLLPFNLTK